MTEQFKVRSAERVKNQYATCEDFFTIFGEDLRGLYQLSFLLTGDHQKAERCFVTGMENCAKENYIFREWARAWARRVVVENAIRELHPRPSYPDSAEHLPIVSHDRQSNGHFDVDAVLGLADFERFVLVLCVLDRYRERECALLLGCSTSEVREARTHAIEQLARPSDSDDMKIVPAVVGQKHSRCEGRLGGFGFMKG